MNMNDFKNYIDKDNSQEINIIKKLPFPDNIINYEIFQYLDYNNYINIDDNYFWINFGIEHNSIKSVLYNVVQIYQCKYGKSYSLTKKIFNIFSCIKTHISSYLDSIMFEVLYYSKQNYKFLNINDKYKKLLNINEDDVQSTHVFYNLYTLKDIHLPFQRKKVKTLNNTDKEYIKNSFNKLNNYIEFIKNFINNEITKDKYSYMKYRIDYIKNLKKYISKIERSMFII